MFRSSERVCWGAWNYHYGPFLHSRVHSFGFMKVRGDGGYKRVWEGFRYKITAIWYFEVFCFVLSVNKSEFSLLFQSRHSDMARNTENHSSSHAVTQFINCSRPVAAGRLKEPKRGSQPDLLINFIKVANFRCYIESSNLLRIIQTCRDTVGRTFAWILSGTPKWHLLTLSSFVSLSQCRWKWYDCRFPSILALSTLLGFSTLR